MTVGMSRQALVYSLASDQAQRDLITMRIAAIVQASFENDRQPAGRIILLQAPATRAEIQERTNICLDWFLRMRGDMHFSMQKTFDLLPRALRTTLRKESWAPPAADRGWSPDRSDSGSKTASGVE